MCSQPVVGRYEKRFVFLVPCESSKPLPSFVLHSQMAESFEFCGAFIAGDIGKEERPVKNVEITPVRVQQGAEHNP